MACHMKLIKKVTCLSHALILLKKLDCPNTLVTNDEEGNPYFEACDVDEEVVITFEEYPIVKSSGKKRKPKKKETWDFIMES